MKLSAILLLCAMSVAGLNSVRVSAECVPNSVCFNNEDCGSGGAGGGQVRKSFCVGFSVGTCQCSACISGWPCKDDNECGGLKQACDTDAGRCNCHSALKAHGYPSFVDAIRQFCNVKECSESEDCFGLPCRGGRCVCRDVEVESHENASSG